MKSKVGKITINAVAFSVLLLMSSGAQAGSIFALDSHTALSERQIGLFQQAIQWLGGTWNGLASVFEFSEEKPAPPPIPACTTNCGDAGPGIDPIG
ncbi:MAG: hypothetical protein QOH06_5463 [Acidobacteriota bacterium]|nr:hypothetical protein [Acidobacteriota bacterium]